MNSIAFGLFCAVLVAFSQISATIQADDPDRLLELNRGFIELHDTFIALLDDSRVQQTQDERVLQAQLISRIAFVSSQIKDLDFATHRRIIERGLRIGNTAAECIIEADVTLQVIAEGAGQEVMEIATIARKDFLRIPNEFVHPFFDRIQKMSEGFLNELLLDLSRKNAINNVNEMIGELEKQQQWYRNMVPTFDNDLQHEIDAKTKEMNYMRAEVFPILEYTLRYFRQGTDRIIANLENCNE